MMVEVTVHPYRVPVSAKRISESNILQTHMQQKHHSCMELIVLDTIFILAKKLVGFFHMGREIGWSVVSANSKQKEAKLPIEIGGYMYYLQGSL